MSPAPHDHSATAPDAGHDGHSHDPGHAHDAGPDAGAGHVHAGHNHDHSHSHGHGHGHSHSHAPRGGRALAVVLVMMVAGWYAVRGRIRGDLLDEVLADEVDGSGSASTHDA